MCLKNKGLVLRALLLNMIGIMSVFAFCGYGGLVIFAHYHKCDPIQQKIIEKTDQIVPLYVMDSLGEWKGAPGLFVAGIFSGSLR